MTITVYDVLAVGEGHPSGNVLQGAQDEVEVRESGHFIVPQVGYERLRYGDITELLQQQETRSFSGGGMR